MYIYNHSRCLGLSASIYIVALLVTLTSLSLQYKADRAREELDHAMAG